MVYDVNTDSAVDIYLQSGTGRLTASEYNVTHTVSREQQNHEDDMLQVRKRLMHDFEFASAASGGNETTNIVGSSDKGVVGGHVDTAGRRMISFIGCEEYCGYIWQYGNNISTINRWINKDGRGLIGQSSDYNEGPSLGGQFGDTTVSDAHLMQVIVLLLVHVVVIVIVATSLLIFKYLLSFKCC